MIFFSLCARFERRRRPQRLPRPSGDSILLLSTYFLLNILHEEMADYTPPPESPSGPQPHPYLHEPLLYVSGLPPYVTDENLAATLGACAPFRPRIPRDDPSRPLSGTIEFKYLEKGMCWVSRPRARGTFVRMMSF